jgi:hypothetical protein
MLAGVAALAMSGAVAAFAQTALHPPADTVVAQAPAVAVTPGTTIVVAPSAPPPPRVETPPPPPAPSYVWEPGRWSWNGAQFAWEPGKYVERPTVSAHFTPGHWEQRSQGWAWVPSQWN